jgi:RND family efflux transporter MFP subunit
MFFDVSKIPLVELRVAPGQQVKAGEVLARIEDTTLERAVTQAEADLTVAKDDLEKAQIPFSELDTVQARLAVTQAGVALEEAREAVEAVQNPDSELDLTEARLAVDQAEIELQDAKEAVEALLDPDLESARTAVRDSSVDLEDAKRQLVVVQNDPDNAERLRTLEYEAVWYRNNYWEAQERFDKGKIDQQKLDWEYSNMLAAEEKLRAAQVRGESDLANAQQQVTKSTEAYREALDTLSELQGDPDPLELARAEDGVTQAQYNLAKAQEELVTVEAGPGSLELTRVQTQVGQAEYNLAKAEADLAEIEAGPDPKEIEVAQAKVVSAQATLDEARAALKAATMIAPFDGTVISLGSEVGDLISSSTIVVSLADLSNLRVRAIVDETDISKVEIGQEVGITFDAFPGHQFRGQVLEVPLQGTLAQNILTYDVPTSLEGTREVALKPGMTANLSIVVGRRENVLLVPKMAVRQGEDGNVVTVQDTLQGAEVAVPVQAGLSDGMYVEVIRGLNEGDLVVVDYALQEDGVADFRGFGGMMGGMGRVPGGGPRGRP